MSAELSLRSGLAMANGVLVAAGDARWLLDDTGLDALPGLIDLHGDAFERALSPRPGVMLPMNLALAEIEAQLLAAGVTTAYLAVTLSWEAGLRSTATYMRLRDTLATRPANAVPDMRLHVRFEAHNLAAVPMLLADIAAGHVRMLSFNDHTPNTLRKLGNPVAVSQYCDRAGQSYEAFCADARLAGQVSPGAIKEAQARLAAAAREHGIPMASHDDSSLAEREYFRSLGACIAEFPTTPEVARAASAFGETTVMGAPNVVRGGSHTGWHGAEDLVREKACSVLVSDYHYPSLLQAVYHLGRNGSASFTEATSLASANAADAARLADRGRLALGQRADILLVDPAPLPRLMAVVCAGRLAWLAPDAANRLTRA